MRKTDIIQHYGIVDRLKERHNNHFEQFTYEDMKRPTIYRPHQEFAHWEGIRHDSNTCEYFKSTRNEHGWRSERQDELEHRVITPGYPGFYDEITPERLAHDPNDAIYNYYKGWHKNISDGQVEVAMLRSQLRTERKGNYFRVQDQVNRFVQLTKPGMGGPVFHPEG